MNFLRNWLFHHSCNRTIASARELALHGARQRQQAWIALRDAKREQLRREIAQMRAEA